MSASNKGGRSIKERFRLYMTGESDELFALPAELTEKDLPRSYTLHEERSRQEVFAEPESAVGHYTKSKAFRRWYRFFAILCCFCLVVLLLLTVAKMPRFGEVYDAAEDVYDRYVEQGIEETGAVNIVAGLILDYRAFDTLGESFVLFTALNCVLILLRRDRGDEYDIVPYFDLSNDRILRYSAGILVPVVLIFGVYIMFNGHISPGGGFAGGAAVGAALILMSAAFGFDTMNRFFTERLFNGVSGVALGFYCLSKAYSFFCGANHIESIIPKGIPGAIFSAGLILPLNIAVGMVVSMTMFGIYCLFRRGKIGK